MSDVSTHLGSRDVIGVAAVGCSHARWMRRAAWGLKEGTAIEAVYQRRLPDGNWSVLVMVHDAEHGHHVVVHTSPWKATRALARRWLTNRTTAA